MKLNDKRTTSIFKNSLAGLPDFDFTGTEHQVFPFTVKAGFVNSTEKGFVFDSNINDYARFERIFTGFEAISISWDNSTKTEVVNKKVNKVFSQGNSLVMHFDNELLVDDFGSSGTLNYLKEQVVTEAVFYCKNRLSGNDVLKLYIIPYKYGDTVFYIENVQEYEHPSTGEYSYSKVTYHSLNDKIANTGLAIDQFVQFSAPGEGYAFPELTDYIDELEDREALNAQYDSVGSIPTGLLIDGAEFYVKRFGNNNDVIVKYNKLDNNWTLEKSLSGYIVNETKLFNNPIKSVQLEIYGPGILSSAYAYGRRANNTLELTEPRLLMAEKMIQPNMNNRDITKPYVANNDWYWIPRSRLEVESFYENWTKKIQGNWNPAITKKWLGYLRIVARDYKSSSPTIGWRIFTDVLTLGISELAYNSPEINYPQLGYYNLHGVQSLPKLLSRGYFVHKHANRLPLTYKESIPWTLKDIPLVGGFLRKVTLGLPIGWKNQTDTGGKNYNVSGMISSGLLDFYKNTFIGTKTETLPTNLLGSNKEDYTAITIDSLSDEKQPSAISPGEFATVIAYNLTDRYYDDTVDNNAYANKNADGTFDETKASGDATASIAPSGSIKSTADIGYVNKINVDKFLPAPMENESQGFFMDFFGFHFLGQAEYKVTMYDNKGNVQFVGTYNTLSKLTGSSRDWSNNIKLSHWSSDTIIDADSKILNDPVIDLPKGKIETNYMPVGYLQPDLGVADAIKYDSNGLPINLVNEQGQQLVKTDITTQNPYTLTVDPDSVKYNEFAGVIHKTKDVDLLMSSLFPTSFGIDYYNQGFRRGTLTIKYRMTANFNEYNALRVKDVSTKWITTDLEVTLDSNGLLQPVRPRSIRLIDRSTELGVDVSKYYPNTYRNFDAYLNYSEDGDGVKFRGFNNLPLQSGTTLDTVGYTNQNVELEVETLILNK